MSFFKKLFGGGEPSAPKPVAREVYKDFIIEASPMAEGGQFRLRAVIRESEAQDARQVNVIRADLFASADMAAQFAITKARQVIDEQGRGLFDKA